MLRSNYSMNSQTHKSNQQQDPRLARQFPPKKIQSGRFITQQSGYEVFNAFT